MLLALGVYVFGPRVFFFFRILSVNHITFSIYFPHIETDIFNKHLFCSPLLSVFPGAVEADTKGTKGRWGGGGNGGEGSAGRVELRKELFLQVVRCLQAGPNGSGSNREGEGLCC